MTQTISGSKAAGMFFLITLAFSWIAWAPARMLSYGLIDGSHFLASISDAGMIIGGLGPTLAAFFIIFIRKGRSELWLFIKRAFALPPIKILLWATLLYPVIILLANAVNYNFETLETNHDIYGEPWMIPALFILMFIMVLAEEFGWRGYAQKQLEKSYKPLTASLIVGVMWSCWHIPMFVTVGFPHHDKNLPFDMLAVTLILSSVIMAFFQKRAFGSLIPAFILHAMINLSGEIGGLWQWQQTVDDPGRVWSMTNYLLLLVVLFIILRKKSETNPYPEQQA